MSIQIEIYWEDYYIIVLLNYLNEASYNYRLSSSLYWQNHNIKFNRHHSCHTTKSSKLKMFHAVSLSHKGDDHQSQCSFFSFFFFSFSSNWLWASFPWLHFSHQIDQTKIYKYVQSLKCWNNKYISVSILEHWVMG